MRKMKRFVSAVIMAAMVGTLCLTGCGSDKSAEGSTGSKSGKQVTVAVVQPMSHTSLDQIRDTITSELGKDENIKVVTDNANGDTTALSSINQMALILLFLSQLLPRRQQRVFMMEKIPRLYLQQFLIRKQQVLQEKIVRTSQVFLTIFQQMKLLS